MHTLSQTIFLLDYTVKSLKPGFAPTQFKAIFLALFFLTILKPPIV